MISSTDLVALVVVGVLLPAVFVRPAFLGDPQMPVQSRMRWNFAYSMFAFALLAFVNVSALELLRPSSALSSSAGGALTGAGVLVVLVAAGVHLPPIVLAPRRRRRQWIAAGAAVVLGASSGGFFAVDLMYPRHPAPLVAIASWLVLLVLAVGAMTWFSGLSPEIAFSLYVRRRRRRPARRRRRRAFSR